MWAAYNDTTRLFTTLIHGVAPKQGVTDSFEIFAWFGTDVDLERYNVATIQFIDPNNEIVKPTFVMERKNLKFVKRSDETVTTPFVDGQIYQGFLFKITDPATLQYSGNYKATIKLYCATGNIVEGELTFYVGAAAYDDSRTMTQSEYDEIIQAIASKADISTGRFVKKVDAMPTDEKFTKVEYNENDIVLIRNENQLYQLVDIQDEDYWGVIDYDLAAETPYINLTGDSGTLTTAQLNLVRNNKASFIIKSNEKFNLSGDQYIPNKLLYEHLGDFHIKFITISLLNGSYTSNSVNTLSYTIIA